MFCGMGFCGPQPERNICDRLGACLKQRVGSVKQRSDSGCSVWVGTLGYFDIFPNGFIKGPYILIFFKGF